MLSRALVNNNEIVITDPSPEVLSWANRTLSYTDKSKNFQLRRMAKNPFLRASPAYAKIQAEAKGQLHRVSGDKLGTVPSPALKDVSAARRGAHVTTAS